MLPSCLPATLSKAHCASSSCLHSHHDLLPSVAQGLCVSAVGMGGTIINAKVALPFSGWVVKLLRVWGVRKSSFPKYLPPRQWRQKQLSSV